MARVSNERVIIAKLWFDKESKRILFQSKLYLSSLENFQLKNQVVYKTEDSVKAVGPTMSRCGAVVVVVWAVERGGGDVTAPLYTKCERRGAPASASQECEPTSRTSLSPHTAYRYAALTDLCDRCCQTYHHLQTKAYYFKTDNKLKTAGREHY